MNSNRFAVNSSTGTLHTTQMLDREEQNKYQLTVQATDWGYGAAAKVGCTLLQTEDAFQQYCLSELIEQKNEN